MATSSFTSTVSVTKKSAESLSKVINSNIKPKLKKPAKIQVLKKNEINNLVKNLIK